MISTISQQLQGSGWRGWLHRWRRVQNDVVISAVITIIVSWQLHNCNGRRGCCNDGGLHISGSPHQSPRRACWCAVSLPCCSQRVGAALDALTISPLKPFGFRYVQCMYAHGRLDTGLPMTHQFIHSRALSVQSSAAQQSTKFTEHCGRRTCFTRTKTEPPSPRLMRRLSSRYVIRSQDCARSEVIGKSRFGCCWMRLATCAHEAHIHPYC